MAISLIGTLGSVQCTVVGESVELNLMSACRAQLAVMLFGELPLDKTRTMENARTPRCNDDGTFLEHPLQTTQICAVGKF
eukprot:869530-Lingulodinium_polyedra.AAC.1